MTDPCGLEETAPATDGRPLTRSKIVLDFVPNKKPLPCAALFQLEEEEEEDDEEEYTPEAPEDEPDEEYNDDDCIKERGDCQHEKPQ